MTVTALIKAFLYLGAAVNAVLAAFWLTHGRGGMFLVAVVSGFLLANTAYWRGK